MHTDDKGDLSELRIMARLIEIGYTVSVPWGKNQRYDLVVDTGSELVRAQCKTGWLHRGCVVFNTASNNRNGGRKDYRGQADWFLVYCQETDAIYRVPVNDCGVSSTKLRLDTPDVIQPTIRWAKDYIL